MLTQDAIRDANPANQLLGVADMAITVLSEESFQFHPITRSLGAAVVLPDARTVDGMLEAAGLDVQELMLTSPQAWGERNPEAFPNEPGANEDVGELPVMAAVTVEDPAVLRMRANEPAPHDASPGEGSASAGVPEAFAPVPGGRLAVIGDSDFASNTFLAWGNNRDLALNTVAWLLDEEAQIGERPAAGDALVLTEWASSLLCMMSLFVVPGSALSIAALTLWRRRRL